MNRILKKVKLRNFLIVIALLFIFRVNAQNLNENKTDSTVFLSSEKEKYDANKFPFFNLRINDDLVYHFLKNFKSEEARNLFKEVKNDEFYADSLDNLITKMQLRLKKMKKKDAFIEKIDSIKQQNYALSKNIENKINWTLNLERECLKQNITGKTKTKTKTTPTYLTTNTDILPAKNKSAKNVASDRKTVSSAAYSRKKVEFRVQIGAYSKNMPANVKEKLKSFKNYKTDFVKNAQGQTICTIGVFNSYKPASILKTKLRAASLSDAFIVAYLGTRQIPVKKALELVKQ